jgi:hypothetical protein
MDNATTSANRERTKLEHATEAFAANLASAILAGTERDYEPAVYTEPCDATRAYAPPVDIPPDGPKTRQQLRRIAYELESMRRKQFSDDLKARLAPPLRERPAFDCLEVTDLTDETCRYPHEGHPILFCGRPPEAAGAAYCEQHARVCYGRGR